MTIAPGLDADLVRWARPKDAGGFPEEASRVLGALGLALLSDPTEESLAALRDCGSQSLPEPFTTSLTALACAAASTELLTARVEYTRIFHHPQGAPCPPWESVALDAAPHLMGPRHRDVTDFFHRAGVAPRSGESESADHIGLELTFLSLLASRIAEGDDQSALFDEFWSSHVVTWIPEFAKRLAAESKHKLYAAVASLLLAAVNTPAAAVE